MALHWQTSEPQVLGRYAVEPMRPATRPQLLLIRMYTRVPVHAASTEVPWVLATGKVA